LQAAEKNNVFGRKITKSMTRGTPMLNSRHTAVYFASYRRQYSGTPPSFLRHTVGGFASHRHRKNRQKRLITQQNRRDILAPHRQLLARIEPDPA
jgi:hypothetical protein